jgi:UDP-N-acetylmuramate dehydrogenase
MTASQLAHATKLLRSKLRGRVETDWPLAPHTTYKIGGSADLALFPVDAADVAVAVSELKGLGLPWVVLGGGSNVLVSDRGVRGAVVITTDLLRIEVAGDRINAGAGVDSHQVALSARDAGLRGAEFLAWLPGTFGGACLMNARAYGGEISLVLQSALCVDNNGSSQQLIFTPHDFSYKQSPFQQQQLIIAEACIRLAPGDTGEIQRQIDEIEAKRRANHEMDHPSCGCIFKNDYSIGISSGQLIDQCGLKGFRIGAAQVSPHHANFILNLGNASASEIMDVIEHVRQSVKTATGHALELEVQILGEWDRELPDRKG